jgi:two-component system chemotaxis response regulator CheY
MSTGINAAAQLAAYNGSMSKRVILVGHCSPDSSYLSIAVKSVLPDASVERVNNDAALQPALEKGADLLLVNRVLDGDFADSDGIGLVKRLTSSHPNTKVMLVSNYPDAQARAVAAGALPGFGKSELNAPRTHEILASALGGSKL